MISTGEIAKLKGRIRKLEAQVLNPGAPYWIKVLAKEYVEPAIKAAVKEHVDRFELMGALKESAVSATLEAERFEELMDRFEKLREEE